MPLTSISINLSCPRHVIFLYVLVLLAAIDGTVGHHRHRSTISSGISSDTYEIPEFIDAHSVCLIYHQHFVVLTQDIWINFMIILLASYVEYAGCNVKHVE